MRRLARLFNVASGAQQRILEAGGMTQPPARVRREIRRQQDASEVLVGWVQIGAILTFATLYAISPKAFPPDVPFEPVPWTLAIYAGLTCVRLLLAYRRRLTSVVLTISVVVDMVVLMVTIWSFHLQYGQPPGLYVKAPTLMYVFILIALRALRFEVRYVVLSGALAAVGWLVLVAYAVAYQPDGMEITRDYARYMTSYDILLGAEVDKIISFGMVTGILALTIARARRLLLNSVTEQAAATELSRFFIPAVADQIRQSEVRIWPGTGEVRQAAILFLDIRGFTTFLRSRSPDDAMTLLSEYQRRIVPIIERHGGGVDKFLGDGILASFGAVVSSTTYASDALSAVEAVFREAAFWRDERTSAGQPLIEIGAAVTTGTVLFGVVGSETRLEYTVVGDPVNLAAKLEKHNKQEGVHALTTDTTYTLAVNQGYTPSTPVSSRPEQRIEGIADLLDLIVLIP